MRMLLATILVLAVCGSSQTQLDLKKGNNSESWPGYSAVPQLPRNSSSALEPLYKPYSNKTPVFKNDALIQKISGRPGARFDLEFGSLSLDKRQSGGLPTGTCAPGVPCTNGACCSNTGVCSYAPTSCGVDVCISNCDAKAPCGEYADPNNATCPLNVCCSQYGFCKASSTPSHYLRAHADLLSPPLQAAAPTTSAVPAARRATEAADPRPRPPAPAVATLSWHGVLATTRAGQRHGHATWLHPRTWN